MDAYSQNEDTDIVLHDKEEEEEGATTEKKGRNGCGTTFYRLSQHVEAMKIALNDDPAFPDHLFDRQSTWVSLQRKEIKGLVLRISSCTKNDPYRKWPRRFEIRVQLWEEDGLCYGFTDEDGLTHHYDLGGGSSVYFAGLFHWLLKHMRQHIMHFPAIKGEWSRQEELIAEKKEQKAHRRQYRKYDEKTGLYIKPPLEMNPHHASVLILAKEIARLNKEEEEEEEEYWND